MSEGVWGCRTSCIEPGLPSGRVTTGGAFCNTGVHRGGVWESGTSMEGLPLDLTYELYATVTESI